MQNLMLNFSSLENDLNEYSNYRLSRVEQDAYSYFRAEYHRALPPREFEGFSIIEEKKRINLKEMLLDLKERLLSDSFILVPHSTATYQYIQSEYRQNGFIKDFDGSYVVPTNEFKPNKTRKKVR